MPRSRQKRLRGGGTARVAGSEIVRLQIPHRERPARRIGQRNGVDHCIRRKPLALRAHRLAKLHRRGALILLNYLVQVHNLESLPEREGVQELILHEQARGNPALRCTRRHAHPTHARRRLGLQLLRSGRNTIQPDVAGEGYSLCRGRGDRHKRPARSR